MRYPWPFLILALAGCATKSQRESVAPVVTWPEWTSTPVALLDSIEEHPVPRPGVYLYPNRAPAPPSETVAAAKPIAVAPPPPSASPATAPSPLDPRPAAKAAAGSPSPAPPDSPKPGSAIAPPAAAGLGDNLATQTVKAGKKVMLEASAGGSPPFSYQWMKDRQLLPNGGQAHYIIDKVSAAHAGVYVCLVSNSVGAEESPPFKLIVTP